MKKSIGSVFLAFAFLTVLLSGCAPASTPVPPTLTFTPIPPTDTPVLTATPTKLATATTPSTRRIIEKVLPENIPAYSNADHIAYTAVTEDQLEKMIENTQSMDAVSTCPGVWVANKVDKPNPQFGLFVTAAIVDKDKPFIFAIHPTLPEIGTYSVSIAVIPPDVNGKFIVGIEYQPTQGEPNPEELEIKVIFPGCEIYKETVTWP